MERCKSSKEAVELMGSLAVQYGHLASAKQWGKLGRLPADVLFEKRFGDGTFHAWIWANYNDQPAEVTVNGGLVWFSKGIYPQIPLIQVEDL